MMEASPLEPANLAIPRLPVVDREEDAASLACPEQRERLLGEGPQPWPAGTGARTHYAYRHTEDGVPVGTGYSDFVRIAEGFYCRIVDAEAHVQAASRSHGDEWLKIEVFVSGRQAMVFDGLGQVELDTRWCNVHLHPPGITKGEWVPEGTRQTGIILYVEDRYLAQLFRDEEKALPENLARFARGESRFLFESLPVSSAMARALDDLLTTPLVGALRHLLVEARARDILAAVIAALNGRDGAPRMRLGSRDRDRILEARAILDAEYVRPPSIVALARRVGVNQQKLKVGFKQIMGKTIAEYYQDQRLKAAWSLLRETDQSIAQIGYELGYEFPTNFSTAFKRRFGITPYRFRRGGRAPRRAAQTG